MNYIDEHTFNGFRYIENYEDAGFAKIIHDKDVPDHLYKYYGISEYNVNALINSYLYASHPYELNDILDSSRFLFTVSEPFHFEVYKRLFKKGVFESLEDLRNFYEEDIKNDCGGYISAFYSLISKMFGIISLSENENNDLMWPHYTQEKGFQLKFKSKILYDGIVNKLNPNDRLIGLFPINYSPRILPIDISKFRGYRIPFVYSTNIKFDKWRYENEWRILISKPNMGIPFSKPGFSDLKDHNFIPENRYISYDIDSIENICLGMNFFSGSDFYVEWKGDREFIIEPIETGEKISSYLSFLNFIVEKFSDKLFVSGIKYEMDDKNLFLVRTREKVIIKKMSLSKFHLIRTEVIIKY